MVLARTALTRRLLALSPGGDTPLTSYGANALAFTTPEGTLVVDPFIAPAHASALARELRRLGLGEVTQVVVTHHHTDHALGAGYFASLGATVIMHERAAEAMR